MCGPQETEAGRTESFVKSKATTVLHEVVGDLRRLGMKRSAIRAYIEEIVNEKIALLPKLDSE